MHQAGSGNRELGNHRTSISIIAFSLFYEKCWHM